MNSASEKSGDRPFMESQLKLWQQIIWYLSVSRRRWEWDGKSKEIGREIDKGENNISLLKNIKSWIVGTNEIRLRVDGNKGILAKLVFNSGSNCCK